MCIRDRCIDYFKKCPVWKRVFTGFRDKYLSYGRFAGKIVIKKLSSEEIEELEGFFGQNFHGQRSVTTVSYTHLDVYKRQIQYIPGGRI